MKVEQISIFLENKEGRIAEVTSILYKADVNIRALSLADTNDFGVLRLIVDKPEIAEKALKDNEFTVGKTNVVAVEVDDQPGGLHKILTILDEEKINVEYMYAYVPKNVEKPIMIFRFDNIEAAINVLESNNIKVVSNTAF
ncbi:MAG: amino acid-binding protein [Desulfobacterales bacterium]|nr:amino acid-binding protein [Desulfobacterales bacterium]